MSKRDLFVIVADLDAENTIKTLLCKRQESLRIRVDFNPSSDLLRYSRRDSGCYKDAVRLLRPPTRTHRHALLCFDRHGCGADDKNREEIEAELECKLPRVGWPNGTAAVVVLEPEVEAWIWADSPHVASVLGWRDDRAALREYLETKGLWDAGAPKPNDPKVAMEQALRKKRQAGGARLFASLALNVTVQQCQDPSFRKFHDTLKGWFPA